MIETRDEVSPPALAVRVETAARMLDAPAATVTFWIREGRLPAVKIGRSWRVRVADLDALLTKEAAS